VTLAVDKFATAPFPWFGGKRSVVDEVWQRLGRPTQYIEPFCGSAAMLLGAPAPASLEVIGDQNLYVANFWRCIKFQPEATYRWQDYPVSHVDLDARHRWLTEPERTAALLANLSDPEWPGDAQLAGWWVWGQCAWIGSGWCERTSKLPHVSDAGRGVQSQIPHVGNAGRGVQSQIPHVGNAGAASSPKSLTSDVASQIPFVSSAGMGVQGMGVQGMGVMQWFSALSRRMERVRIIHGDWSRCLNHHYGANDTAIFFDPPYRGFESLYAKDASKPLVADEVAAWCRENGKGLRVALCGHVGDYDLPGWEVFPWSRGKLTYGGAKTTANEAIWFSPSCAPQKAQLGLFGATAADPRPIPPPAAAGDDFAGSGGSGEETGDTARPACPPAAAPSQDLAAAGDGPYAGQKGPSGGMGNTSWSAGASRGNGIPPAPVAAETLRATSAEQPNGGAPCNPPTPANFDSHLGLMSQPGGKAPQPADSNTHTEKRHEALTTARPGQLAAPARGTAAAPRRLDIRIVGTDRVEQPYKGTP